MTPQKLRRGGDKAGTASRGGGVLHTRTTPSRQDGNQVPPPHRQQLLSTAISTTAESTPKGTNHWQGIPSGAQPANSSEQQAAPGVSMPKLAIPWMAKVQVLIAKNTIIHVTGGKDLQSQEANDISSAEFLKYFKQLPTNPAVDTYTKLDDDQLLTLYERHARYRIRYLKLSQTKSKSKLNAELKQHNATGLLEEDLSGELLAKMRYFKHFEEDDTLDWMFHPDLCRVEALDDYQRLVPRNHGGREYTDWDKYIEFFYSYEIEQEYLNYCKELSKKLKWMEDYVMIEETSLKWDMISTRGAYQAIKIATDFTKITGELAYMGYYECVDNLRFDAFWRNDLDGVYFEIWLRLTKMKSFRDALEEVHKLEMFPLSQDRMKYALDSDCSDMETKFRTCTASVTSEVPEDKARELIAEAVKKIYTPKMYEDYIRKKIAIAQAIGLVPSPHGIL